MHSAAISLLRERCHPVVSVSIDVKIVLCTPPRRGWSADVAVGSGIADVTVVR